MGLPPCRQKMFDPSKFGSGNFLIRVATLWYIETRSYRDDRICRQGYEVTWTLWLKAISNVRMITCRSCHKPDACGWSRHHSFSDGRVYSGTLRSAPSQVFSSIEVRNRTRHFKTFICHPRQIDRHPCLLHNNQQCASMPNYRGTRPMPAMLDALPSIMVWDEVLATVTPGRYCLASFTARSIMWSPC